MGIDLLSGSSTGYTLWDPRREESGRLSSRTNLTPHKWGEKHTLLWRCGKVNSGLWLPVKHKISHLSEIKVRVSQQSPLRRWKTKAWPKVSHGGTKLTESRKCINMLFKAVLHIQMHTSRLERYGHVKLKRRCDLWLFDSNIHYSILLPVLTVSAAQWIMQGDILNVWLWPGHRLRPSHNVSWEISKGTYFSAQVHFCILPLISLSFSIFHNLLWLNDRWFIELFFLNACWKCQLPTVGVYTVESVSLKLETSVYFFFIQEYNIDVFL